MSEGERGVLWGRGNTKNVIGPLADQYWSHNAGRLGYDGAFSRKTLQHSRVRLQNCSSLSYVQIKKKGNR